jgi:hypothetical protein
MPQNIQGPIGPQGPNYSQQAQVINNNNYYYSVPQSHYQDSVSFQGAARPPQGAIAIIQNGAHTGACQAQVYAGGPNYQGLLPSQECDLLFQQCDAMIASWYNQPQGSRTTMVMYNDPLADLRGMEAMVMQAIRECNQPQQQQQTEGKKDWTDVDEQTALKVQRCATAINDAVSGLGTDEATIKQVLEGLTPEERGYLEIAYANMYGYGDPDALRDDLKGDLSWASSGINQREALNLLNEGAHKHPVAAAIALHDAMDDWGTDEETVKQILSNASPEEAAEIEAAYAELYGNGNAQKLRDDIRSDFGLADSVWDSTWKGGASGAAVGASIGAVLGLGGLSVPFAAIGGVVGGAVGSIVGGITGLFRDSSGDERQEHLNKLNQGALSG